LEGGKFFFNTVREGDSVLFATEDEQEASAWVMAFYRATGQAHKPAPPVNAGKNPAETKKAGGIHLSVQLLQYSNRGINNNYFKLLKNQIGFIYFKVKLIGLESTEWKNISMLILSLMSITSYLSICSDNA